MMETSVIETKLINAWEIGYVSQVSSPDIKMAGKQAKRANQEEVRRSTREGAGRVAKKTPVCFGEYLLRMPHL
jgi:hypothetical protein